MNNLRIVSDHDAFMAIKEGNHKQYIKTWDSFKEYVGMGKNWNEEEPKEEEVMGCIKMCVMALIIKFIFENCLGVFNKKESYSY